MVRVPTSSRSVELPHSGGRLFQQYLVDAYTKLESTRLDWVIRNQDKLRMETLQGLCDHVAGLDYTASATGGAAASETSDAPILRALGARSVSRAAQHGNPSQCHRHTGRSHVPANADMEMSRAGLVSDTPISLPRSALGHPLGKRIILPATFGGSPRDLHQCYLDAMAIVAKYGRPDFFITMTANPNWPEVRKNLRHGETASDRPDIVARVFRMKLRELVRDLTIKGVLGKSLAYTHVVEFQKRGLPHAHLLLILSEADKPRTPADVDRLVSAEVPDRDADPKLYHLVEKFMVHGPCGALDPSCPCMDCLLYTSPSPRDLRGSRMPSSA